MPKQGKLSRVFDREWVLKVIFASSFNSDDLMENYELIREKHEVTLSGWGKEYLKLIEKPIFSDILEEHIKRNLAKVDLVNVSRICQVLLQMGTFEMLYYPDIPPEVSINEIVRLAGLFVDDREKRLVNSVLDKVFKDFKENNLLYSEYVKPLREKSGKSPSTSSG